MKNMTKPTKEEMLYYLGVAHECMRGDLGIESMDAIRYAAIRALVEKYGDGGPKVTMGQAEELYRISRRGFFSFIGALLSIGVNVAGDTDEHQD